MEESGVLKNIRKRHYPSTIKDCNESKVPLGYNQLWFPIIILFDGIVFSVILGCLESAYHKTFQNFKSFSHTVWGVSGHSNSHRP